MSYRLQHHTGENRWILDRGAPRFSAAGAFLGFYGGCAEISADVSIPRVKQLHQALFHMRDLANHLATTELPGLQPDVKSRRTLQVKADRLQAAYLARQHAAQQIGQLVADMLAYDHIPTGACLH